MASVKDEIIGIINEICRMQNTDLSDETKPLLQAGLDSLDYSSVLLAVEDRYDLRVVETDIEKLASLRDIVRFVEAHKASAAGH
jgi:acyl carrier protein